MDANISIELCAAQKVRQQKVEKYFAKVGFLYLKHCGKLISDVIKSLVHNYKMLLMEICYVNQIV